MALCEVHWHSLVLKQKISMSVILPEVGTPPFATYYLLHGLSDDHTTWVRRTRVEWYVRELPLIVVMPDGLRGSTPTTTRARLSRSTWPRRSWRSSSGTSRPDARAA